MLILRIRQTFPLVRPSRFRFNGILVAVVLVVLVSAGCGGQDARPRGEKRTTGAAELRGTIARSAQSIYDYCVATVEGRGRPLRADAVRAIRRLEAEYRRQPNTPYAGRGRDAVRRALQSAGRQLDACDPALATPLVEFLQHG
jgi:hypothetical protein